jgi:hypothetical protein
MEDEELETIILEIIFTVSEVQVAHGSKFLQV